VLLPLVSPLTPLCSAVPRVAIERLHVGPWCAACVVAAAVLPVVSLSGGCVQQCAAARIAAAAALLFVSLLGDCMSCGSVPLLTLLPLQPLRCSSCRCQVAVCRAVMCCCPCCRHHPAAAMLLLTVSPLDG